MNIGKEILAKLLRRFIKDFTSDQLTLRHMLSGTVELGPGVAFDEVALQQLFLTGGAPVNFELRSMVADTVTINMPWAQLSSRSTRVSMGEVEMEVIVHDADEVASVLLTRDAGSTSVSEEELTEFARTLRKHLLAFADKRRLLLDTAKVTKRGLSDFAKVGLRTTVGKMKVTFLRPSLEKVAVLVMDHVHVCPCGSDGRPTLHLRHSLIMEPKESMPHLPSMVRVCSINLRMHVESVQVLMPEKNVGSLRRVISASHCVARMKVYEACNENDDFLIAATGRFLGFRRIFECGVDAQGSDAAIGATPALQIELGEDDFLTLVTLFADYSAIQSMLTRWRLEQAWKIGKSLPTESSVQAVESEGSEGQETDELEVTTEKSVKSAKSGKSTFEEFKTFCAVNESSELNEDSDEELLKTGQQTLVQLSAESRLNRPRLSMPKPPQQTSPKNSTSLLFFEPNDSVRHKLDSGFWKPLRRALASACESSPKSSSEHTLMKGWLLKRGHIRPLMDSWQDRWCELVQLPGTRECPEHGVLRYYKKKKSEARRHSAAASHAGLVLHGEVFLRPGCGMEVQTFQEAAKRYGCSEHNKSAVKQMAMRKEFPHGFEVLSGTGTDKGRVYYFAGHSPLEMRRWVESVRMLLFKENGISGSLEDFVGSPVPRNPLTFVAVSEEERELWKDRHEETRAGNSFAAAFSERPALEEDPQESRLRGATDYFSERSALEEESGDVIEFDQEDLGSADSFLSAESEDDGSSSEDSKEDCEVSQVSSRSLLHSEPSQASSLSLSEKLFKKSAVCTKNTADDLVLWGDLNTIESMRMSCPSMTFKLTFNPQGSDDAIGESASSRRLPSKESTNSTIRGRKVSKEKPQPCKAGLIFHFKDIDIMQICRRRQSLPECLALARLVKTSMDEVLRSLLQSEGFGPNPSVYRSFPATTSNTAVASQMEVTSLDEQSRICHTVLTPDAQDGPMHGHFEELSGTIDKVDMKLQGWRVQCTPEVKSKCGEPFQRVLKRAAEIMKAGKAKVPPKMPPREVHPPKVSISLQDMMADVPGPAGANLRVRLLGSFEVDSLESLAQTISSF